MSSSDAAWLAVKGGEDPSKRILRSRTLSQDAVEVNEKLNFNFFELNNSFVDESTLRYSSTAAPIVGCSRECNYDEL